MTAMTDTPLGLANAVQRLGASRDAEAWGRVLATAGPLLEGLARRTTGDRDLAHDAVQETLLQVRDLAGGFHAPVEAPDTAALRWIMRITANTCLHLLRRERRVHQRARRAAEVPLAHAPAPESALLQTEALGHLRSELAELPPAVREAIVLRHIAGLGFADVAAALGTTEDAAKKRVCRGLDALRLRLGRLGIACTAVVLASSLESLPAADGGGVLVAALGPELLHSPSTAAIGVIGGGSAALPLAIAAALVVAAISVGVMASRPAQAPQPRIEPLAAEPPPPPQAEAAGDAALRAELARAKVEDWPFLEEVVDPTWPPIAGKRKTTIERAIWSLGTPGGPLLLCDFAPGMSALRHEAVNAGRQGGYIELNPLATALSAVWTVRNGIVVFSPAPQGSIPCVDLQRRVSLKEPGARPRRLVECLAELAERTGLAIRLQPGAQGRGERVVDARIVDLPLEWTLHWLGYVGGLAWWTERGSVVFGGEGSWRPRSSSASTHVRTYDVTDLLSRWPKDRRGLVEDLKQARYAGLGRNDGWFVLEDGDGGWENLVPADLGAEIRTKIREGFANVAWRQGSRVLLIDQERLSHEAIDHRLRSLRYEAPLAGSITRWLDEDAQASARFLAMLDRPVQDLPPALPLRTGLFRCADHTGLSLVLDPSDSTSEPSCTVQPVPDTWRQWLDRLPGIRWRVHRGVLHVVRVPAAIPAATGF